MLAVVFLFVKKFITFGVLFVFNDTIIPGLYEPLHDNSPSVKVRVVIRIGDESQFVDEKVWA